MTTLYAVIRTDYPTDGPPASRVCARYLDLELAGALLQRSRLDAEAVDELGRPNPVYDGRDRSGSRPPTYQVVEIAVGGNL